MSRQETPHPCDGLQIPGDIQGVLPAALISSAETLPHTGLP